MRCSLQAGGPGGGYPADEAGAGGYPPQYPQQPPVPGQDQHAAGGHYG